MEDLPISESLQLQHGRVREFLSAQRHRWREAEDRLRAQLDHSAAQLQTLRARCEELERLVAEHDTRSGSEDDGHDAEDFQRLYQMALDDVRELKARNAELEKQLADRVGQVANVPRAGKLQAGPPAGALDWEAEKRRILAALESDFPADDAQAAAERLKIEEIIRTTDLAVAEKDREIEHLQTLLKQQSSSLGSVAVGAAALEEVLDKDAIIREERESLKQLQDQWRGKLRQAEIEISVERAKIARREAEVQEKLRSAEQAAKEEQEGEPTSRTGKPVRGRWLARLGLTDPNEPRTR